MGLSIYYGGHLKKAELLPALIGEVKDVAKIYNWKYHIYNTVFPDNQFNTQTSFDDIYGISFTPPNCETISFSFLSNGKMVCPSRVNFFAHSKGEEERLWIYTTSVKTQYAGVVFHQFIIHFFKYLNNKYFNNFKMSDESNYWETNDEETLKMQFKIYDTLMDNFMLALETFPVQKDENILAYFERLMKHINELKK
ncbi:hypothetical protein A9P82_09660 [Arachidicoccus ginsenosidimutans]|uniref:hypothetical protein n=1 Tax=Arachidicoccus sp. BS20 TaxID=1850526 RepID=UPI0007F06730|nr:hypothetical protein [Arachidicoccus sp. BS20]ANI89533.1 hypothetical protein A9P82_09660 [Arachidicoccus sp. BS20]